MKKELKSKKTPYVPMPAINRSWLALADEYYTQEELNFREFVLRLRSNSGIHKDFLINPSSWFGENSQALINPFENNWFHSNSYKTRHMPSMEEFHVQPIDSKRLQWPALYELMQKIGDYLILRNGKLRADHYNQPMNFVFMDVNNILKQLSQSTDIEQVRKQLELLTKYLRNIEKKISPVIGSDRLFLANLRFTIDNTINPELTYKIGAQLLKSRLENLNKTLQKLLADRYRITHFGLNSGPVNPHPHEFTTSQLDDTKGFPTLSVIKCSQTSQGTIEELKLSGEQLAKCPDLMLINSAPDVLDLYAQAVTDLYKLKQFQTVITQVTDLLGQAGEVYTVVQFKEQLLGLLRQIDLFTEESNVPIEALINENTQAYHKAIQDEQNLSLWQQWTTSEKEILKTYIKNQDTLAHFPSTSSDLAKAARELKTQVSKVVQHLNQPMIKKISIKILSEQVLALDTVMGSMYGLIKSQYDRRGIEPPSPLLTPLKPTEPVIHCHAVNASVTPKLNTTSFFLHSPPHENYQTAPLSPVHNSKAIDCKSNATASKFNPSLFFAFEALAATGVVALSLYHSTPDTKPDQIPKKSAAELKSEVDELIVSIQNDESFEPTENSLLNETYNDSIDLYERLSKKPDTTLVQIEKWDELLKDLQFVKDNLNNPIHNCRVY